MRVAVVLFQLGGPDSLEAVEPFLFNLFSDPDIIDFPFASLARKPLARFIASRRSKKVAEHYREIGGKSPIIALTNLQAAALQRKLDETMQAQVFVAMRYWPAQTGHIASSVANGQFDRVVLLPLYPQYSTTTSGSSLNEWNRQFMKLGINGTSHEIIHHFFDHPKYLEAVVSNVNKAFTAFAEVDPSSVTMVFSAHGVPLSVIEKGDPYKDHIEQTVRLILDRGKWASSHVLCYQSKVGSGAWLQPSLHQTIHDLALRGKKHLLVVPIAFVTDHVETLHEINIEARDEARKLGILRFEMMPALNDHPLLIEALADEVSKRTS